MTANDQWTDAWTVNFYGEDINVMEGNIVRLCNGCECPWVLITEKKGFDCVGMVYTIPFMSETQEKYTFGSYVEFSTRDIIEKKKNWFLGHKVRKRLCESVKNSKTAAMVPPYYQALSDIDYEVPPYQKHCFVSTVFYRSATQGDLKTLMEPMSFNDARKHKYRLFIETDDGKSYAISKLALSSEAIARELTENLGKFPSNKRVTLLESPEEYAKRVGLPKELQY